MKLSPNRIPLTVHRVDRLARAPRPEMLIPRVLARGGVAVVASPPYMGKTFLALEAMRAVVQAGKGDAFLGHFPVPRAGNVLYLGNDSPDWDIASQFDKLIGLPDPNLYDVGRLIDETDMGAYGFIFEPGFMLNDGADAERVIDAARSQRSVRDYTRTHDDGEVYSSVRGTDLIVIDTLRSVHGYEENDNTGMQHVMNLLRYIALQTKASVLALHHFNKGTKESPQASLDRLRGATAIGGAVDTVFALTGKAPSIAVRVLKHRACPEQGDFTYEMIESNGDVRLVMKGDGIINPKIRTVIMAALEAAPGQWVPTGTLNEAAATVMGLEPKAKKAANAVTHALAALEKAGTVTRIHGATRLAVTT